MIEALQIFSGVIFVIVFCAWAFGPVRLDAITSAIGRFLRGVLILAGIAIGLWGVAGLAQWLNRAIEGR